MTNSYTSGSNLAKQLRQLGLTALLAGGTALAAQAQFNYSAALTTNIAGTYTDLGTNGTVITTSSTDDANSAAQNIGFTFNYNGTAFTQFVLNTNGLMRLGSAAPSSALAASAYGYMPEIGPINSTDANDVNLLMPFNFDLMSGTGGAEYRVYTTGTAPNRVCTIQWKNVADKVVNDYDTAPTVSLPTQYTNFSFQVKLYEANNQVDFVYGPTTAGTVNALKFAVVGLKGSSNLLGQDVIATKVSASAWSTTTFLTGPQADPSTANAHNFRSVAPADAGRTYRFVPAVANDAAVSAVYTLGKLPTAALPHAVQAVITNVGTSTLTNQAVTLNVTGANTFSNTQTVATLAAGATATVTFTALPSGLASGVNTVTVSVPADGNNANNSVAVQQTVNSTGTFSYVPTNLTTTPASTISGLGAATPASGLAFGVRYTTVTGGTVTAVSAYIQDVNAVGKSLAGVVMSTAGAILGQSANYTVLASDINAYHTFVIPTPPTIAANGSFLAGMVQIGQATAIYPMGVQTETPGRTGTYYVTSTTGGTLTDVNAMGATYRFMLEGVLNSVLATSKELQRAITVYPNPSESGIFNLNIQNANATGGLSVEVTNQLGQRVFAGSARDNFTTQLNLSNLSAGIYHLQVRNGQDYTSSQISIVK